MGQKNLFQHYFAYCWDIWNRCWRVTQLHNAKCYGWYAHPSALDIITNHNYHRCMVYRGRGKPPSGLITIP